MTYSPFFRRAVAGAVSLVFVCAAASAQDYPAAAYPAPAPADPVDVLSAHLRTLAASPRNYLALIGAGDAALQVGDPNAALGFFARAEKVDPRSGRAKAGLGAALVALERPDDALPLFAEAVALGVGEADIARDRGLAYDLRGDSKRAQRDYALALARTPDDETTRRMALSLGISGDPRQALALLEPLLRKKDQSAWRARAFVMAMNGDVSGANGIARQVMPGNLADTMAPFLGKLASLNAADRAHAVNFGTMPATGIRMAAVELGDPFRPIGGQRSAAGGPGDGLIPAGDPLGPRPEDVKPVRVAEALSNDPRRRPGREIALGTPTTIMPKPDPAPARTVSPAPVFPPAAAPGFSVAPALPAAPIDRRLGERIGARIAAVDPARLPPEARDGGAASVIVGTATTALPKPKDRVVPPAVVSAIPKPEAATVVAPVVNPIVTAATSPPKPENAPLVTAAVSSPKPVFERPVFETTAVPAPAVKIVAALPPSPAPAATIAAAPPLIGPPAERQTVTVSSPASLAAPVLVSAPAPVPVPSPMPTVTVAAVAPPATPVATASLLPPAAASSVMGAPAETPPAIAAAPAPVVSGAVPAMAASPVPPVVVVPPASRLASVLDGIEPEAETAAVALPSAAEIRAARRAAARKATAAAAAAAELQAVKDAKAADGKAEQERKASEADAAKRNPARLWVQIATGSNTRGLGTTWARIRNANETALKGRNAWAVPFKATNRLLVGPMKSSGDARALVNALAKSGVSATTFSSDAGQEVTRVGGK